MFKKFCLSCIAIAALAAVALPASASAVNDPQLTESGGLVKVGEKFVATNIGNFEFMSTDGVTNQFGCSKAVLTGSVTANAAGTLEGSITSAQISSTGPVSAHNGLPECTVAGGPGNFYFTVASLPLTLKSTPAMANDEVLITGPAGAKVKFIAGFTVSGACEYETTSSALTGTYTTAATTTLSIRNTQAGSGLKLIKGGFLCPTSFQLRATFLLETENGTELGIS
jgi:hypothetical protein